MAARTETGGPVATRRSRALDLVVGFVAAGIALATKMPMALHPGLHHDDSIVAVMAKDILDGCGIPAYIYGAPLQFGAVLNVYLLAPICALFGYNPDTLTLAEQIVTLLLAASFYVLILRYHGRWAALAGTVCLTTAIPLVSIFLMWADHHDLGLILMNCQMLLFFRVYLDRSDRPRHLVLLGAVSALAFRVSGATLVLTSVCFGLLLLECARRPAIRRGLAGSALAGAGVILALAFFGGLQGASLLFQSRPGEAQSRLAALAWESLRGLSELLMSSFRLYVHRENRLDPIVDYILLALTLLVLGLALAWNLRRLGTDPEDVEARFDRFAVLYLASFFVVYVFSPWSRAVETRIAPAVMQPGKYLLYTYPAFILLGAHHLRRLPRWIGAIGIAAALGVSSLLTYRLIDAHVGPTEGLRETVEFLESEGLTRVYAEVNLALPIMAYSAEKVIAANLDVGQFYAPWAEAVWGTRRVALAYTVARGDWMEARSLLKEAGIQYKIWQRKDFMILYDFDRSPLPLLTTLSRELDPAHENEWLPATPPRYFATQDCRVIPSIPLGGLRFRVPADPSKPAPRAP